MSSTACFIPIIAALFSAETTFIQNDQWQSVNDQQETFIAKYLPYKNQLENLFSKNELKTRISPDVNDVNNFLAENNFDIQLQKQIAEDNPMYLASIMNILVKWEREGTASCLKYNETTYPSVTMNYANNSFSCFTTNVHSEPIIALKTQSDDTIFITIADQKRSGLDLLSYVMAIPNRGKYEGYTLIKFPMIDIDEQPDVSWLVDIKNGLWWISEALQQTKFQMNEEGAAAQNTSVRLTRFENLLAPNELIIDKPFFLWIKRKGLDLPVFAAYLDIDTWKRPNKLG